MYSFWVEDNCDIEGGFEKGDLIQNRMINLRVDHSEFSAMNSLRIPSSSSVVVIPSCFSIFLSWS